MKELKRILLATNFDSASYAAMETAAALARPANGSIYVLCVLEALMYDTPEMAAWAERDPRTHPEVTRQLQETLSGLLARGVKHVNGGVEYGIAADIILRHANEPRFDLVVVGSHGHVGGVEAVLHARAKIPVVAVPAEGQKNEQARAVL
jgi:nucleotide-binding universal stress UspA family protein